MWKLPWLRAWKLINSPTSFPSFLPAIIIFWRKWQNSAPPGASGRVWLKNALDQNQARSQMLRFHTQTGGSTLTAQQPENNIARTTIQALAAILGGTQSLHTNSMDEALSLPSEKAVRVALRTQQIIAHESGVADSVDPLAGSYLVESLTNSIEELVIQMIHKIDGMGGALAAIDNGYIQSEIQESAYRFQKAVENGSEIIVGVNDFQTNEKVEIERLKVDPAIEAQQVARLAELRASRNGNKVKELMAQIESSARSEESLMPLFITCVENELTLGEICGVLRKVWGEYQPPVWG